MVGGASSLLRTAQRAALSRRGLAFAGLAAIVVAYYALVGHLWEAPLWWDIAWLDLVQIPAVFLLVWLVLPAWRSRGLIVLAIACGALAFGFHEASAQIPANFAKLAAMTFFAWWFLSFFETLSWVVVVACIIPFVDAYSVWRGPTNHIVNHQQALFSTLSFAFPVPGGHGVANLGLPDLLFFALFLAAAVRFGLRPLWTWFGLVISVGATMALAVAFDVGGLPALPGLSIAFLGINADLIRRRLQHR